MATPLTVNEPVPALFAGWIGGVFPPGKSFAVREGLLTLSHMMAAHARAYDALHANDTRDADGDGQPVPPDQGLEQDQGQQQGCCCS